MKNKIQLKVHKGQRSVLNDGRRFKVVVAGRRWGKTQTSKTAIIKAAAKPRQLIWYVAPTYGMARSIMWEELKESIPARMIVRINETRMSIQLKNKTRIELKGADKPDTLRGVGLDLVVVDEAQDMDPDTWYKVLYPTLTSTGGRAYIIGTPKAFNWLYDVYMLGQRGDVYEDAKGRRRINAYKSWQFPTITSPFIPAEEIEQAKANLDEKSFKQEFEASFETMSGRVYYAFDRNIHVGSYKFDPKRPVFIGQDFNIDPMSSVILQPQDNGEIWAVGEVILFGSNTQETADEVARRYHRQMKQITFYPDPAGNNRSSARGESDLDILRESGFKRIKVRRKHPRVADRVNSVNRLLMTGDGQVRLRVDESCKHLIAGLEQTIYKPNSREVDKSQGLEHPCDALGYYTEFEHPVRTIQIGGLSL
ncbi:MAG: hypothetical protein JJ979_19485 [Roseibium sp.]|nr:hypothetical protein [Roseibium sp.]